MPEQKSYAWPCPAVSASMHFKSSAQKATANGTIEGQASLY